MNLVPLNDQIVMKRDEAEDKTPGGIVLPDGAREKPQRGKVLAVGDGKMLESGTRRPMCVSAGDRVLFVPYAAQEVTIDGEKLLVMSEDHLLGVFK